VPTKYPGKFKIYSNRIIHFISIVCFLNNLQIPETNGNLRRSCRLASIRKEVRRESTDSESQVGSFYFKIFLHLINIEFEYVVTVCSTIFNSNRSKTW
jgi:hypothetical protein